jgi:DNA-binding MarR family transcriptional regulator
MPHPSGPDALKLLRERDLSLDDLLSGTFQSVLRIEEKSLDNKLTRGLSITDIHTIVAIGLHEKHPMYVTAQRLNVTTATLSVAVNKLEQLGHVKRERCEEDRRKVLLSLTTSGRKVYRAHRTFHRHMVAEALSDLSKEEQRVLASALSKLKAFFDEHAGA